MEFIKNRNGYLVSICKTHRECVKCGEIYEITSKNVRHCKKCNNKRVKSYDQRGRMLNRAKERSKKSGLECKISKEDIVIPEFCPILGIKLEFKKGSPGGHKNSPSLDRIDNSKGYIKGNIRVISHLANQMKSYANNEELLIFAKWIINSIPDQD